jgi:DNA-binding transcriptional ArsR family regulator
VDDAADALEAYLKSLASSGRLRLLRILRSPRTLDEIRLERSDSGVPMSRQSVQEHLDRLMEVGLVRAGHREREGRRGASEYLLDHARLFDILEELRRLAAFEGRVSLSALETQRARGSPEAPAWPPGPKLVLVHGVEEGRVFPLPPSLLRDGRGWVVGRAPHAHVRLDYDPYVSADNSEVLPRGGGYALLDVRSATNGTSLNWTRLPPGGEARLSDGDIVGVGRSLLVFRSS